MAELKAAYAERIAAVRREAAVPAIDAVLARAPPPIAPAAKKTAGAPPGVKTLAAYVDVAALARHEQVREIELIWRARFAGAAASLCAVVPAATFARMAAAARRAPMFVLPLARAGQGTEMHLLQWTFPAPLVATVMFTTLEQYKLHGEFAAPHTTLSHHLELADDRGVVLAQGEAQPDSGVSVAQAQFLVVAMQKFYGAFEGPSSARRQAMLDMFARGDPEFSVDALIREVEMAE